MPTVTLTNSSGSYDITRLVDAITISGEYRSCARTLEFGMLSSMDDRRVPEVDCSVGSSVVVEHDGEVVFNGFVFDRTKGTSSLTIDLSCTDRGIYLNRNQVSKSYTTTPEAATKSLCSEFGISCGAIATTGVVVQRKFFSGSIYDVIATLYTEAAKTTKEKYHIGFVGDKLTVRRKGSGGRVLLIRGGSNLMSATTTESGRNIVNRVIVEDETGAVLYDQRDAGSISAYGQMQQILRQAGTDRLGEAKKLIESNSKVEQRIVVENLGGVQCVTGDAVMLEEPYTRLCGLFYIDGDVHTWKNGLYFNKLNLNLQAVMDERSAGELLGGNDEQ